MACDAEDNGFQMINDDEIVTSVQEESDSVDDKTNEDEENYSNKSSKGPSIYNAFSVLETAMEWYEQQPECFPTQLLLLKRITELAVKKRRCTMVQRKNKGLFSTIKNFRRDLTLHSAKLEIKRIFRESFRLTASRVARDKSWSTLCKKSHGIPSSPRAAAVAKFRLLTGHDCLCAHLFRFNLVTSPICVLCDTGQDMTAAHLDECSALNDLNCIVKRNLTSIIARLRTGHFKGMKISSDKTRTYIPCKNCTEAQLTPDHILECPALTPHIIRLGMAPLSSELREVLYSADDAPKLAEAVQRAHDII
ncbi:uncharacterized protein TNCV_3906831 [Trichonephila clavipes]|nr:uncharacterized protein TNCV_3906831 [Trichonephila clavipes]